MRRSLFGVHIYVQHWAHGLPVVSSMNRSQSTSGSAHRLCALGGTANKLSVENVGEDAGIARGVSGVTLVKLSLDKKLSKRS